VAPDRLNERCLVTRGHRREGVGGRGADAASVECRLGLGGKTRGEGMAARDPALAAFEQGRHRRPGQTVVVQERVDDPRLVHGGEGPRRSVGAQEKRLGLGRLAGRLDHDRHLGVVALECTRVSLEAVDDFERAIALGHDPERHLGERVLGRAWSRCSAQARKARPQPGQRRLRQARRAGGEIGAGGAGHGRFLYPSTRARRVPE